MPPSVGRAALRLAIFLIIAAGFSLIWIPPGSAEFIVSILTIGIGAAMLLLAAILIRKGR